MAVKHNSAHTADNQLTAAEYDAAHTVEANTIVDADIGAHTTTKITSPEAQVTFGDTGHAHSGGTGGKQVDHGALGGLTDDDHTQYQKESEKGAASGYASLDASTLVPLAQIPATLTGKDADTLDTKHYTDISTEIDSDITTHAAVTATHGAAGAIVGTTNTQTLSGKTLTTPKMDVIAEETAAAGVTVDGLLIKDSGIAAAGVTSGVLAHERGGIEADISAVALGGLIVGTGAGTMGLKTVGTNDQVLTADSAVAGGVKWAAGGAGAVTKIVADGANANLTGSTAETTIKTVTITGATIGTDGKLVVKVFFKTTGTAGTKTVRVRLGGLAGTILYDVVAASGTQAPLTILLEVFNRNAQNSQYAVGLRIGSSDEAGAEVANSDLTEVRTAAVDTSVNQDLVVTGQLAYSADQIDIRGWFVELFK